MALRTSLASWRLTLPESLSAALWGHLFPGDHDEHGAVILAGLVNGPRGPRVVARRILVARDGIDYVPGVFGYRRLTPEFVRAAIVQARDENCAYIAVHNHGGTSAVDFSDDDRASHERGYPALLDIARGQPVGAIVVAERAVAGSLWMPDGRILALQETRVVGRRIARMFPTMPSTSDPVAAIYDRQTRIFGSDGQRLLTRARIGILGAGGAGMLLVEYLSRLGVGELIVIDPDRVSETNLPRLPGATFRDVNGPLGRAVGRGFGYLGRRKIDVARRLARQANPAIRFIGIAGDVADADVAARLTDVDYLFCAADSMRARLVFNSLVNQYGIPGIQVGAKVASDAIGGRLLDVRSVVRFVTPDSGCLWCNGLISPVGLAAESLSPDQRAAQRYVDDDTITAPAVITLNAIATSLAANAFLLAITGAEVEAGHGYITVDARRGRFAVEDPRKGPGCTECGEGLLSRRGRGDAMALPVRAPRALIGFSRLLRPAGLR